MKPKVGLYHFVHRGDGIRIYRYDSVSVRGTSSTPVPGEATYFDQEQARKRVYELNGWTYNKK